MSIISFALRERDRGKKGNYMVKVPELQEMLQNGVHFGHQVSRWHPKMAPFIFGVRNGVHIFNLEVTAAYLEKALKFIEETSAKGGVILFVGTKRQAQEVISAAAKECQMPYVNQRWIGGLLTNFPVILKLLRKYKDLKSKQESGKLAKYTKKEQLKFEREIAKMDESLGGIASVEKIPDAIFILDIKKEKTALLEAKNKGVPVIGVCDTNVDPSLIDYPIPANDDARRAIELICKLVSRAVQEGRAKKEDKK